jgi:GNAT superfamily N-acetyltransferase
MNPMKQTMLLFLLSCFMPAISSPTLVPFDKAKHQAEAARIFKQHFRTPTFAELLADNIATIKICMDGNTVIGVLAYQKKDTIDAQKNRNRYLYYVAIDTQHQSKGYGTACMKLFEEQSRHEGVTSITLDPSTDIATKDPSLFFKEKLSYKPVSVRSNTLTKTLV